MWFQDADPDDLQYLTHYDVWGGVPIEPIRLPGLGRYGRYTFDRTLLLRRCDLTVAQKKEVIFLSEHFHRIDHFEYFDVAPSDNLKPLKKSYFRFSKRFHPDTFIGADLGGFEEHVRLVFEYGQHVYQMLSTEPLFLASYSRVTQMRDEAYLIQLQKERERLHKELKVSSVALRRGGQQKGLDRVISLLPKRSQQDQDERKAKLRERLAHNQERRQGVERKEIRAQAENFYYTGLQAEKRKQWTRAFNQFKLCIEYMPEVPEYREAFKRVEQQLHLEISEDLWRQGEDLEKFGMLQKAISFYEASLEKTITEENVMKFAEKILYSSPQSGIRWVKSAIEQWPHHLDLKWSLVQLFKACSLFEDAYQVSQEMLHLDPSEPRAFKFIKKFKKS